VIEKYFTVEEAELLIPKLEQIVESLMENKRNAMEIGQDLARMEEQLRSEEGHNVDPAEYMNKRTEMEFLVRIINEGLESIEDLGAQPKDLDLGLVDFPALINGEEVLLCWKYGEKSIGYYHDHEEGFSGRKPLAKES
jgi:hypothetical protein